MKQKNVRSAAVLLLAVLLLLAAPCQTLAANDSYNDNYYEEWGPMEEWTEEQGLLSESWTWEEWDAYRDAEWKNWEREWRQEKGFTNLDGPNVIVNGTFLQFDRALPLYDGGSLMLPAKPLFTAMGATLSFDNEEKMLTATLNGDSVRFRAGSADYDVITDRHIRHLETKAMPFIDSAGAFYVPLRPASESFGRDVLWDQWDEVAEIIDGKGLIAAIDEKFTVINRLMQLRPPARDERCKEKTDFSMGVALYGDEKDDRAAFGGQFTTIYGEEGVDLSGTLQLNVAEVSDTLLSGLDDETTGKLNAMKETELDVLISEAQGVSVNSKLLSLLELTEKEGSWLQMDQESFPLSLPQLLAPAVMPAEQEDLTVGSLFYDLYVSDSFGVTNTWEYLMQETDILQGFFGDETFTVAGSTYTIDLDRKDILKALAGVFQNDMGPQMGVTERLSAAQMLSDAGFRLVFTEKDGALNRMELDIHFKFKMHTAVPVAVKLTAVSETDSLDLHYEVSGRYGGKMFLDVKSKFEPTDLKPRTAPPAGAVIEVYEDASGWSE